MHSVLRYAGVMFALMILLAGCAGLSGATTPAPTTPAPSVATGTSAPSTAAPRATEPPGSTDAAPIPGLAEATTVAPAASEPAAAGPTVAPTAESPATAAPEPTMPPAATEAAPEIACVPGALTPAQTEGPYYTENPPETNSLLQPGMPGTKITLTGYVLDEQCRPIPGARVDFWQADAAGQYDNQGYTLRGYQLTGLDGRYSMETIIPGEYPGRTPHIHVKVTSPGAATLTSQLYLPEAAANATDRIFSPDLVVDLQETDAGLVGAFNFVVRAQ